ncbi:hypothetical protein ACJDU8_19890 [Clostridium sp. WILCCON 0269]|uniref:Uncharacterized protein n=1 Tax=Candidatus Clostridium eludens TaxID=3381663 RepID=A0ABW8SP05_9CLOT
MSIIHCTSCCSNGQSIDIPIKINGEDLIGIGTKKMERDGYLRQMNIVL